MQDYMVVLDESSSFKNPQAKRFKKLKLVRSRVKRIVELTGTPAPNGLEDLFAQVYLLDGGERLGRTMACKRSCCPSVVLSLDATLFSTVARYCSSAPSKFFSRMVF